MINSTKLLTHPTNTIFEYLLLRLTFELLLAFIFMSDPELDLLIFCIKSLMCHGVIFAFFHFSEKYQTREMLHVQAAAGWLKEIT